MPSRHAMNHVVLSKRKRSVLEIIGNFIIYFSPILLMASILFSKWNKIVQVKTSVKIEFAFLFLGIIMLLVYYRILKKKVKEKLQANKINQEKNAPILCLFNLIFNLLPYVIILLAIDFFKSINEPANLVLICLLILQGIGHFIIFIDSFREAHYE